MAQAVRRLPGIRFETQAPPSPDVLPRMDVAGFVGFASAGPLHLPVPVEDAAQFAQVFGPDAPLAWDEERGEQGYAYLGPAVRAFFRNGGRRCWVVRVADRRRAARDRFAVPGLAQVAADGSISPAVVDARAVGSWADGLRVSSWLEPRPVRLQSLHLVDVPRCEALVVSADEVVPGDLIRVSSPGGRWTLLFVVDSARRPKPDSPEAEPVLLDGARLQRLEITGVPAPFWVRVAGVKKPVSGHLHYLGPRGERHVSGATIEPANGGLARISLDVPSADAPLPGALVRGVFAGRTLWVDVADRQASKLVGTPLLVRRRTPSPAPHLEADGYAEKLALALRVEGEVDSVELGGLGLAPAHPRFLGKLPHDETLYADPSQPPDPGSIEAAAAQPRFPLAGPDEEAWPACYLPLGASILPGGPLPAIRPPGSQRVRDGLRRFRTDLFLDPKLATTDTAVLLEEATRIRYGGQEEVALLGVHSLLGLDEVTIVVCPDAVQRGWRRGGAGRTPHVPAPDPAPEPDGASFVDCAFHVPAAPVLSQEGDEESGAFMLLWTPTDVPDAVYELQEAPHPTDATAVTIWTGPELEYSLYGRPPGSRLFYRVRAIAAGTAGGWSNWHAVRLTRGERWFLRPASEYVAADLLDLELALLRLCAARGDLFAVLALPEHYRERTAATHVRTLRATGSPPGGEPNPIFGFGAVYHPWLYSSDSATPTLVLRTPPDGAAAGVMASRAVRRGAWVAPANEALRDVVALDPPIGRDAYQLLQDAQVNLVRQDPAGFLWLAADTLTEDETLRPIGVRRLLQVLRRAAVLYGSRYAFEPNGDPLRRAIRRTFEGLLTRMFELGAFAGASSSESFRVLTGSPPNTPQSVDEGRLIVELQVAPSRPLTFLTVRFVRSGAGTVHVESR